MGKYLSNFLLLASMSAGVACKHQSAKNDSDSKSIIRPLSAQMFEIMYAEDDKLCVAMCEMKPLNPGFPAQNNSSSYYRECKAVGSLPMIEAKKLVPDTYGWFEYSVATRNKIATTNLMEASIFNMLSQKAKDSDTPRCDSDQSRQFNGGKDTPYAPNLVCAQAQNAVILHNPFAGVALGLYPRTEDGLAACSDAQKFYSGKGFMCATVGGVKLAILSTETAKQVALTNLYREDECRQYIEKSKFGLICLATGEENKNNLYSKDGLVLVNFSEPKSCLYAIESHNGNRVCVPLEGRYIAVDLKERKAIGRPVSPETNAERCVEESLR